MRYLKKKPRNNRKLTVLFDDHENYPWLFLKQDYEMKCKRLKTGDYTIEGYEDIIAIEKKSGIEELLNDLTGKYRPTFKRFLERLSRYPVKCIVVEEPFLSVYISSAVARIRKKSRGKSRLTEHTVYWWTAEIILGYGIPILFAPRQKIVRTLFESAIRKAQEIG